MRFAVLIPTRRSDGENAGWNAQNPPARYRGRIPVPGSVGQASAVHVSRAQPQEGYTANQYDTEVREPRWERR